MIILMGLGVSLAVFFAFFWFFSNTNTKHLRTVTAEEERQASKTFVISSKDIETIAGDDVLTTQLDLARAYLETDRKNLAKSILSNVLEHGSIEQKQEAKRLLGSLQMVS